MTRMINMCDKLFFVLFFHLKLRQHNFSRYKMKKYEKKFFIFYWRSATLTLQTKMRLNRTQHQECHSQSLTSQARRTATVAIETVSATRTPNQSDEAALSRLFRLSFFSF